MKTEDVIRMAREAGCIGPGQGGDPDGLWEPNSWENVTDLMFKFADIIASYEREECAKLCEEVDNKLTRNRAPDYAVAIRARKEK